MKRQKKHIYLSWIITLVILFQQIAFLPLHQIVEDVHNDHHPTRIESKLLFEKNNIEQLSILGDFQNEHCNLCDYFLAQVGFIQTLISNNRREITYLPESFYFYSFSTRRSSLDNNRAPPFSLFS